LAASPLDPPRPPPRPPWGSAPISELAILSAFIVGAVALTRWPGEEALILCGVATGLAALAGLEVALREHLAGFRPHSGLLAAVAAIPLTVLAGFTGAPLWAACAVAVGAMAAAVPPLRRQFKRRAQHRRSQAPVA
jgi:hypothetical protein